MEIQALSINERWKIHLDEFLNDTDYLIIVLRVCFKYMFFVSMNAAAKNLHFFLLLVFIERI